MSRDQQVAPAPETTPPETTPAGTAAGWPEPEWAAATDLLRRACAAGATVGLIAHVNPDSDSLGSALALGVVLRNLGARPVVSFDGDPFRTPDSLEFLPGQDLLVPPADFPDPVGIAVTLDVGSPGRLGRLATRLDDAGVVLVVDHHRSGERFGTVRVVDPDAASTSLVVAELVDRLGYTLTADVATALYAGLVTDTGSFRQAATNPAAHRLAATLVAAGADPTTVGWSVWGMHSFAYVRLLGDVLGRARLEAAAAGGLGLAWTVVTRADFAAHGLDVEHVEGVIDVLWGVRQAETAAVLKQTLTGGFMVSLRSRGRVDVGAVAAKLGGGGHREKAGFDTDASVEEIVAALLEQLAAAAPA